MKKVLFPVVLGIVTSTAVVAAQERSSVLDSRTRAMESPQDYALEFRFSPYRPDVDSEPGLGGRRPYADVFGGNSRVLVGAQFDFQLLRIPHVGTLGPGLGLSYTTMSARAKLATARAGAEFSDESTSLEIFPAVLLAVLRIDALSRELRIPLVPYLKAGVAAARWRATNESGTSSQGGIAGKGTTYGTHVAAGLAFDLNVLDSYAARSMDSSLGINHTYLFVEGYSLGLTGIGQSNALRVGATSWAFGLAFEM